MWFSFLGVLWLYRGVSSLSKVTDDLEDDLKLARERIHDLERAIKDLQTY